MSKIKLLVVDDSMLFREVLSRFIRQDPDIDVVGTAGDAYSARDMILKYEPDVMTLDIEMPKMDGVAFLKKLLPQYYLPTIVVSSSIEQKSAAIGAGAVDFIQKPLAEKVTTGGTVGQCCDKATYQQTCINGNANALVCWDGAVKEWTCADNECAANTEAGKELQVVCKKDSSCAGSSCVYTEGMELTEYQASRYRDLPRRRPFASGRRS